MDAVHFTCGLIGLKMATVTYPTSFTLEDDLLRVKNFGKRQRNWICVKAPEIWREYLMSCLTVLEHHKKLGVVPVE